MKKALYILILLSLIIPACNTPADKFITSTFYIINNVNDSINVSSQVLDSEKVIFHQIEPNKTKEIFKTSFFLMIPTPSNTFRSIHVCIHEMDTVLLNIDTVTNELWKTEQKDEVNWNYYLEINR